MNVDLNVKDHLVKVRVRTWTLTLAILVGLGLYFFVHLGFSADDVNLVNLIFVATLQIIMHCIYFPDGENYGMQSASFKANKKAYNTKASEINEHRRVTLLREYCQVEYLQRRQYYIDRSCASIGIEPSDLALIPKGTDLKKKEYLEVNGKLITLTKRVKKVLYQLLSNDIPIEPNKPETILSAMETDESSAIEDKSIQFKRQSYCKKILMAVVVGVFFAYLVYYKQAITIQVVVQLVSYMISMFTTAVMSYTQGETCITKHKNKFYIDLINFIDGFNEWADSKQTT